MSNTQMSKRRIALEQFLAQNPGDAFARYGLALECAKDEDSAQATHHFRLLLEQHPDYVTGYFQFGLLLGRLHHESEAKDILMLGIEAAKRTGNSHALEEMQAALLEYK